MGFYGAGPIRDYPALTAKVAAVPGVVAAIPVLDGQVLLSGKRGQSSGGMMRGMVPSDMAHLPSVAKNIVQGSLDDFKGEDAIAIGVGLAGEVRAGGRGRADVDLAAGGGDGVRHGAAGAGAYKIVALFQVGMNEYDTAFVFLPMEAAQIFIAAAGGGRAYRGVHGRPDAGWNREGRGGGGAAGGAGRGWWIGRRATTASLPPCRWRRT